MNYMHHYFLFCSILFCIITLGPGKENIAELDTTTFMISAMQNDGVVDIKNYLISMAVTKPWILSKDGGNKYIYTLYIEN